MADGASPFRDRLREAFTCVTCERVAHEASLYGGRIACAACAGTGGVLLPANVRDVLNEWRSAADQNIAVARRLFEDSSPLTSDPLALEERREGMERHSVETREGLEFQYIAAAMRRQQPTKWVTSRSLKLEADDRYEGGEFSRAVTLYTKAIAESGDGATRLHVLYGNRSAALFMSGQFKQCIEDCLRVTELDPSSVKMYHRASKAALAMGDLREAQRLLRLVEPSKLTGDMHADSQKIAASMEAYESATTASSQSSAVEHWQVLVARFPDTLEFRVRLACSLLAAKLFEKAAEILGVVNEALRTSTLSLHLGRALYLSGFEHFDRARISLQPHRDDPSCRDLLRLINAVDDGKQRGNTLFSSRNYQESAESYTLAIQADPSNDRVLRVLFCNRAAAYKELGLGREGVEDCTKAIGLDPNYSKAYARRARCLLLVGDHHSAVADFKMALQLDVLDPDLPRELRAAEQAATREDEQNKDPYHVLGLTRECNEKQVKAKYKELSLRWHPDKCMTCSDQERAFAERKFKVIGEAYNILSDPVKRREYDYREMMAQSSLRRGLYRSHPYRYDYYNFGM